MESRTGQRHHRGDRRDTAGHAGTYPGRRRPGDCARWRRCWVELGADCHGYELRDAHAGERVLSVVDHPYRGSRPSWPRSAGVNIRQKSDPPSGDEAKLLEELVTSARRAGVDDRRLLEVMRQVPRAAFVPLDQVRFAYHDVPVPIPHSQVTTQPSLSARMIQALRLAGGEHILEVGTGYGYQTALLGRLASFVTSIERWADLADH